MKSYNEIKHEKIFDIIEKIKTNKPISKKEIMKIDNFFSDKDNQIFLGMILSKNISFNLGLLEKTIYSTFKNNFNLFRSICENGINPTIYVGYSNKKDNHKQDTYIKVGSTSKPFVWLKKDDLKNILNYLHNTKFNLNIYYYLDGVININDLNKLKLYSNLILIGESKNSFINLNSFSKKRLNQSELQSVLL